LNIHARPDYYFQYVNAYLFQPGKALIAVARIEGL
jgi:hypothetical protein